MADYPSITCSLSRLKPPLKHVHFAAGLSGRSSFANILAGNPEMGDVTKFNRDRKIEIIDLCERETCRTLLREKDTPGASSTAFGPTTEKEKGSTAPAPKPTSLVLVKNIGCKPFSQVVSRTVKTVSQCLAGAVSGILEAAKLNILKVFKIERKTILYSAKSGIEHQRRFCGKQRFYSRQQVVVNTIQRIKRIREKGNCKNTIRKKTKRKRPIRKKAVAEKTIKSQTGQKKKLDKKKKRDLKSIQNDIRCFLSCGEYSWLANEKEVREVKQAIPAPIQANKTIRKVKSFRKDLEARRLQRRMGKSGIHRTGDTQSRNQVLIA